MKHDALREKALANFELLLNFWKVSYKKIGGKEYDILATWRTDRNFGSCRFNVEKGRGADFAGSFLTSDDYKLLGNGFTKDDFSGFSEQGQSKIGFDVIGLCQRIYNCNTYKSAIEYLESDFREIARNKDVITPAQDAAIRRAKELEIKSNKLKQYALDFWESSKYHKFDNSPGDLYLTSRGIYIKDKNIRFNPNITHSSSKHQFPALIFKVQEQPNGPLVAIHRIYLTNDGKKAPVDNPKMALASIKGSGIWFGEPYKVLYITEGPENALSLRELGSEFVVSSIFGPNMPNIKVPTYVKKIVIVPDPDKPGLEFFRKAIETYSVYTKMGVSLEEFIIDKQDIDLNDLIMSN